MTVRIFSQVPPDRIHTLWVDGDSHTSIALATVMWRELYDRRLELKPFDARTMKVDDCESVLLIGDKVVNRARGGFAYEIDLGGAWRQHTGLPFVFAVWAGKNGGEALATGEFASLETGNSAERGGEPHSAARRSLFAILAEARDRGCERAREIAEACGPRLWWPTELAIKYLARCLKYKLDPRYVEGANLFAQLCARAGAAPPAAEIVWPEQLLPPAAV